jgi:hypothetical protein
LLYKLTKGNLIFEKIIEENEEEPNSCLIVYLQGVHAFKPDEMAKMGILSKLLSDPIEN